MPSYSSRRRAWKTHVSYKHSTTRWVTETREMMTGESQARGVGRGSRRAGNRPGPGGGAAGDRGGAGGQCGHPRSPGFFSFQGNGSARHGSCLRWVGGVAEGAVRNDIAGAAPLRRVSQLPHRPPPPPAAFSHQVDRQYRYRCGTCEKTFRIRARWSFTTAAQVSGPPSAQAQVPGGAEPGAPAGGDGEF